MNNILQNTNEKNIPQNTRSTPNENYIIPIPIVRLLSYTVSPQKKKRQEGNDWNLEVSGSNNGTHFTQQQKKLNCNFHYESSIKLNDKMTEWFFQFIYKVVTK
jgi:DMSO/TMAO reductase YedYZ molybdopterin-dependent catalytic subunit